MRNTKGFTLIEIIVAVALVAILSAAIAPSVLNNLATGRIARAQTDVQAIAQGVMRFKADVGKFPRLAKGSYPDTAGNQIDFLASLNGDFPDKITGANWPADFTGADVVSNGSCQSITNHLIKGISLGNDSLYDRISDPKRRNDPTLIGFRSGLLSSDPADPWGNKYISNVAPLGQIARAVWVISAGPNGILETAIISHGTGVALSLAGDDVGFRVQ